MDKRKKQTKRDIYLAIILFVVLGAVFVFYRFVAFNQEAAYAHIYYGSSDTPLVTIDFIEYTIIENGEQDVPEAYYDLYDIPQFPYIEITSNESGTITLLGDYMVNGMRQLVVIRYHYERKSVMIIEETSPNNICSREGESTGWPLICLPNGIRIEFESSQIEDDFSV